MRVCVFCGSSDGVDPVYRAAAAAFGEALAGAGHGLVYGGGKLGLMGAVADAALAAGGEVIGVIPRSLVEKEVAHRGLTELHVVASMHERKARMADLGEGGFVALPGGLGTLEELFEVWTWAMLGYHRKPVAILDVNGYFAGLLSFLDDAVRAGFVSPEFRGMLLTGSDPDELLARLAAYVPAVAAKWSASARPTG